MHCFLDAYKETSNNAKNIRMNVFSLLFYLPLKKSEEKSYHMQHFV